MTFFTVGNGFPLSFFSLKLKSFNSGNLLKAPIISSLQLILFYENLWPFLEGAGFLFQGGSFAKRVYFLLFRDPFLWDVDFGLGGGPATTDRPRSGRPGYGPPGRPVGRFGSNGPRHRPSFARRGRARETARGD